MRLKEFSAQNYRSITTAYNLPLSEYTVLVGPNNEGKSNILRALGLGLKLLSRGRAVATTRRSRMRLRYREMERFDYDWIRDFPVSLQASKPDSGTSLYFTFKLTKADFQDFRTRVESNLQTDLKVKLDLGQEDAVFDVMIQGKAKKYLKTKAPQIAEFIGSKILVQYIPATRTSEMAHAVVNELLEAELASIEKSESYKKSIRELDELQRPVRERVSKQIAQTMGNFIPNLKSVSLAPDQCSLQRALRASVQVMIDDGALTELEYKGDGMKSLAAISLLRHISQESLGDRHLILAVEEPETHLHPKAIHKLKQVLYEIAAEHQVIITTHSPVLVEREKVGSNILVETGNATRARRIKEIRDSLGVELADNLVGAYLVVLTEGDADAMVIKRWLSELSPQIRTALSNGSLVVEGIGGASKLAFKAKVFRDLLCNIHAFLDNDQAGKDATAGAIDKGIISGSEYTLCSSPGMRESELEDLVKPSFYRDSLIQDYGVDIDTKSMQSVTGKWSDRMAELFKNSGKLWREHERMAVKRMVASVVSQEGLSALDDKRRNSLDNLVSTVERKLAEYSGL